MDARPSLDHLSDRWEDMRFAKWMVEKLGIEVYPATVYYSEDSKDIGQDLIRSCFAKVSTDDCDRCGLCFFFINFFGFLLQTDDTFVKVDTILTQYVLHAGNNVRK